MSTSDTPAPEAEIRFASLATMQSAHRDLLRASKERPPEFRARILRFLEHGRQTGSVLDTLEERSSAQSLLDYWTATLYSLPPGEGEDAVVVPDAVLTEFDAKALQSVARDAEETLAALSPKEGEVARRVLLQLVGLAPDGRGFELTPARQDTLEALGNKGQVQSILEGLRKAGAVRVVPGEQPERPQVELRSAALTREWPRLKTWLEQRARFREAASNWEQHGRSASTQARGSWLGEALGYHDLNGLEQEFIQASQRGEVRRGRALRTAAAIFFVLAVAAGFGWFQAEQAKRAAEAARAEAELTAKLLQAQKEETERALQESERSRALFKEVDTWRKFFLSNDKLRESVLKAPVSEQGVLRAKDELQEYARVWPEQQTLPYDPDFIGAALPVPLPGMTPELRSQTHGQGRVLDYSHFSLVIHRARAMALYTAANLTRPSATEEPRKESTHKGWFDPRVPREHQIGGEVYDQNDFSRGHLVALQDILWGPAQHHDWIDFAFHVYTNSIPRYAAFNEGSWRQLEHYVWTGHNPGASHLSVFTGPVFRDSDFVYRGIQIPRTFWKIVVSQDRSAPDTLVVDAFLADQYDAQDPKQPSAQGFRRASVEDIERMTGLDFGVLRAGHPTQENTAPQGPQEPPEP
jgi:endonuclease G